MSLQIFFDNFALATDALNGVTKLKELILHLAVKGRLTRQDPTNECADILIARIRKDRERFEKEKNIKRNTRLEPIKDEEIPNDVPPTWAYDRLGNLLYIIRGASPRPKGDPRYFSPIRTPYHWIKISDIRKYSDGWILKDTDEFLSEEGCKKSVYLERGTFILSNSATIGVPCILGVNGCIHDGYLAFPSLNEKLIRPKYLYYFFQYFQAELTKRAFGGAQLNLNTGIVKNVVFPVPPAEEQERIVDKVDELMRLCDELEEQQQTKRESRVRLNNAVLAPLTKAASPSREEFEQATTRLTDNFGTLYDSIDTVAKLRSTIIQLAVQGKLGTGNPKDDSAEILLEKISRHLSHNSKKLQRRIRTAPIIHSTALPFALPSKWKWTRLGRLTELIEYGTSEKASLDEKGVPVFRMNNIESGRVLQTNLKYVSPSIKDLPRLYLKTNDLLFNRTNSFELVGKTGIFKGESDKFTFASYLIRIRLFESLVSPEYLNFAMNADYFRVTQINTEVTQQCGQANFNGTKLVNALIPLPPLGEQKRIVTKVEHLRSLCNDLEAKLREVEVNGERLMNAAVQHVLRDVTSEGWEIATETSLSV